jgi:hypothetical protein
VGVGLALAGVHELRKSTVQLTARLDQISELVSGAATTAGPTAVPDDGSHVVAGRTTYHLPQCRLVAERHDLQHMAAEEAVNRGLAPCRICEPEARAS